jgi:hypothetical protein
MFAFVPTGGRNDEIKNSVPHFDDVWGRKESMNSQEGSWRFLQSISQGNFSSPRDIKD